MQKPELNYIPNSPLNVGDNMFMHKYSSSNNTILYYLLAFYHESTYNDVIDEEELDHLSMAIEEKLHEDALVKTLTTALDEELSKLTPDELDELETIMKDIHTEALQKDYAPPK